jgi:[ribosomal protein S18]-alanine N-acetyltransferase
MQVHLMQPSEVSFVDALAAKTGFTLDIAAECGRDYARLWVARALAQSTEPDAFLLSWIAADELHIIAIGTEPSQRRRGLARQLVRAALDFARDERLRLLILEVRRSNTAATALYRSFGFSISRLRRDYYASPAEDGIEMQLVLDEQGNIVTTHDEVPCLEVNSCLS